MTKASESAETPLGENVVFVPRFQSLREEDATVRRLDVIKLFDLGAHVASAEKLIKQDKLTHGAVFFGLMPVRAAFYDFVKNQLAFDLVKADAMRVYSAIDSIIDEYFREPSEDGGAKFRAGLDFDEEIPSWSIYNLADVFTAFKNVFSAECRKCETYFIGSKKLGYDIETLLHNADNRFHESIRPSVPVAALVELRQAGRCLALESYTASGFHTLRGLEVVMADYHKLASQTDKEFKSWYDYVQALDELAKAASQDPSKKYPSRKVAAMLDRIRELDRNPLMHPRDSLDEQSADLLFSIGIATITELVKDMKEMNPQPQLKLLQKNGEPEGQAEAS